MKGETMKTKVFLIMVAMMLQGLTAANPFDAPVPNELAPSQEGFGKNVQTRTFARTNAICEVDTESCEELTTSDPEEIEDGFQFQSMKREETGKYDHDITREELLSNR